MSGSRNTLLGAALIHIVASAALAQTGGAFLAVPPGGMAGDRAGTAIALDGDTMAVAAPSHDGPGGANIGSVHVYQWTGGGWRFEATLQAPDGAQDDFFGNAIALRGNTVVVGAYRADVGGFADRGAAYVFVRTGTSWSLQAKLIASDGTALDSFGNMVSIHGDTIAVGANADAPAGLSLAGSTYVFTRSGTEWSQQAKIVAPDAAAGDFFGASCAVFRDCLMVGAFGVDGPGAGDRGAVYVYRRSGTQWTMQQKLLAQDGSAGDLFGLSVALDATTAVVGAFSDDVGVNPDQGSAYVFSLVDGNWVQTAHLFPDDGQSGDRFSLSVAVDGDRIAVGAYAHDAAGQADRGAAYIFERESSEWIQRTRLWAPDGEAGDRFGRSVAISADLVAVGAEADTVNANVEQGSAWVFGRFGSSWSRGEQLLSDAAGGPGDSFGNGVAISDGTMVVGAPIDANAGNANQGSASVFVRSGNDWIQQAKLIAPDGAAGDTFGNVVAISGDTLVVGAYQDDGSAGTDQGAAYVFTRTAGVWTFSTKLVASDAAASDKFANAVAISGSTIVIGASNDDVGAFSNQGSIYVFEYLNGSWTQQAKLAALDGVSNDLFGSSVCVVGDTIAVGASADSFPGASNQGSVYIFARSGGGWNQDAKLFSSDGAGSDFFGVSVAMEGDMLLVGAWSDDYGVQTNQGSASLFERSNGNWVQRATLRAPDGAAGDGFGGSVSLSGNCAVIGAFFDDVGTNNDQGSATVFRRIGGLWRYQQTFTRRGGQPGETLGFGVALNGETAVVSCRNMQVGENIGQGSVLTFELPAAAAAVVINENAETEYASLEAALQAANSGEVLHVTPGAIAAAGFADTIGRSIAIIASGSIRTPASSVLTLGGGSYLAVPEGEQIEINGLLQTSAGASAYVDADRFVLGSRGRLTAKYATSLMIVGAHSRIDGVARIEQDATLALSGSDGTEIQGTVRIDQGGSFVSDGPVRASSAFQAASDASITLGGTLESCGTMTLTNALVTTPLLTSRDVLELSGAVSLFGSLSNERVLNVFGSSAVFGDMTNHAGAVATIRSGTLFLFGSLNNSGSIVGTLCANCSGTPPSLEVGGDLVLGPAATFVLPFSGGYVSVGGDFDCAITDHSRFDLSRGELRLDGPNVHTVEAMSADVGATGPGFDRASAGSFPLGGLRIVSGTTVELVDVHRNQREQDGSEAIYVDHLAIEEGALLRTGSITVYFRSIEIRGGIDHPGNLVGLSQECLADFDHDGGVDGNDLAAFFARWDAGDSLADVNADASVDGGDATLFFEHWEAGC